MASQRKLARDKVSEEDTFLKNLKLFQSSYEYLTHLKNFGKKLATQFIYGNKLSPKAKVF